MIRFELKEPEEAERLVRRKYGKLGQRTEMSQYDFDRNASRPVVLSKWQEVLKKKKATATHNSKGEKKDRCAKLADKKYGLKGSAYKSGYMVQCRRGKVSKDD